MEFWSGRKFQNFVRKSPFPYSYTMLDQSSSVTDKPGNYPPVTQCQMLGRYKELPNSVCQLHIGLSKFNRENFSVSSLFFKLCTSTLYTAWPAHCSNVFQNTKEMQCILYLFRRIKCIRVCVYPALFFYFRRTRYILLNTVAGRYITVSGTPVMLPVELWEHNCKFSDYSSE